MKNKCIEILIFTEGVNGMDNNNMYDGNMYDDNNICEANVLSAHTLTEANNYPWQGGEYKVPKVLAEFMIQIDLESKIRLNEPAYEIKRIEKRYKKMMKGTVGKSLEEMIFEYNSKVVELVELLKILLFMFHLKHILK